MHVARGEIGNCTLFMCKTLKKGNQLGDRIQ